MHSDGRGTSLDWVNAVRAAHADDFGPMDALCRPLFMRIARRIASQCPEECVQAGLTKVWRRIGVIDLSTEEARGTVKGYVTLIGRRAMQDELRKRLAYKERASEIPDRAAPDEPEDLGLTGETVVACLVRFEVHGDFDRAFREVGEESGLTAFEVRDRVRREVEEQAPALGLKLPEYKSDGDILAQLRQRRKATQ